MGGLGQLGEGSEEEMEQEGVEAVEADVEHFVRSGCDGLKYLALEAEGEGC